MKRIIFSLLIVSLMFALVPTTFADEASIGGYGTTVELLNNEDIRMVSEVIDLTVRKEKHAQYDYYEYKTFVHVTYNFENTSGNTVTARMGFPEITEYSYGDDAHKLNDFQVLDAEWNEKSVEFVDEEAADTPGRNWYIHEEEFAPGEKKVIQNKYWILNSAYKTGNWFDYTMETGATWKDTIGEVDVIVHLGDGIALYDVKQVSPAGYQFDLDKDEIRWHFLDLEPTESDNINVGFDADFLGWWCYSEVEAEEFSDERLEYLLEGASSFLVESGVAYPPCQVFDGDPVTSWVEGVTGNGIGESLTLSLNLEKTYSYVNIHNGFRESQDLWAKNGRVKSLLVSAEGISNQEINLEDTFDLQFIPLETKLSGVNEVLVSITEVYEGTDFDDTALSEIEFLGLMSDAVIAGPDIVDEVFSDIAGSPNMVAIEYLENSGIVEGYSDGTYRPYNTINRAEFTKIIIGAKFGFGYIDSCFQQHPVGDDVSFFSDTPTEAWYAKYICVAKEHGIIDGYPDGTFRPADNINFVEAAKIVVNTFGHTVVEDETTWYKPYVDKLGDLSAIPMSINTFDQKVDRGEMAEMMYRLLESVTSEPSKDFKMLLYPN